MLGLVVAPIVAVFLLVNGFIEIGPAVSAAEGHGIRGYFVARTESCDENGCSWSGDFKLPDGTITRRGVGFAGSESGLEQGAVIPALDTGGRSSVYQVNSPDQWALPLIMLLAGLVILVGFARMLQRTIRRGTGPGSW